MKLKELKEEVYDANLELVRRNLVIYTWGNVSAIDRENKLVVIKPRGIEYDELTADDMSVVDYDGNLIEGSKLLASVDLDIHLEIYKRFPRVGGIAHTHSTYATIYSQALKSIPFAGTTHADHFYGNVPCLYYMGEEEVANDYERNQGKQIADYFEKNQIDPLQMGAVLCGGHGPFTWGENSKAAVEHSVILEEMAKMSIFTEQLAGKEMKIPEYMLDKHYLRKYGKDAYFYQEKK